MYSWLLNNFMDFFDQVLEFIIGCKFSVCHFFRQLFGRQKSSGEFSAPQFFDGFLADKNLLANPAHGSG